MITTRRSAFTGAFVCMLLMTFSLTVYGLDFGGDEPGSYIDDWLTSSGQNIPIISFEDESLFDELVEDIRIENVIQDKDGSTRFQLSHDGPLSRQVFANVRRMEQGDGFTRIIMTNIADGQQSEYLIRTEDLPAVLEGGTVSDSGLPHKLESKDGQKAECFICAGAYLVYKIACARAETRAFQRCHSMCQNIGGVKHFEPGSCGSVQSECVCRIQPPREARRIN